MEEKNVGIEIPNITLFIESSHRIYEYKEEFHKKHFKRDPVISGIGKTQYRIFNLPVNILKKSGKQII